VNLSETIDLTELMVVLVGIIGLTISVIMLAVIQGDRRSVRASGKNGINKRMTNADLRNELSRAYKLAGFIGLGLLAMFLPPPVRENNRAFAEVLKWMLISWELVATLNSLWSYVDRRRNIEALRDMENGVKH
jgi:hypothetical protein